MEMELYAIKYGESAFKINAVYKDKESSDEEIDFLWMYYIAKYNNKVILFDTGFRDEEEALEWGVKFKDTNKEIKAITGISKIDVIFITHSHFDHIGNLDLYQNSQVIIAEKEFESAMDKRSGSIRKRLNRDNIIKVNDEDIRDGKFRFQIIGGHSIGSAVLYFTHEKYCVDILNSSPKRHYSLHLKILSRIVEMMIRIS
jgi:glyoxylase-like metal-dependent hydrolase (beta-lactamase superfamily II)